ncbi:MAG: hypothetical protein LBV43_02530 [Prevotella sp.]|jgi:hypothetical protein|nr:hypothetical protein [Prevotella sp.]
MKKSILILFFLVFISFTGYAQIYIDNQGNVYDQTNTLKKKATTNKTVQSVRSSSTSSFDPSKLSFGGSFSLQLGSYTMIGISPQVGYDFSKYFTAGAGLGYTYFKNKFYDGKWSSSYLSFDLFGRFYPIEYLVIGIQPEISRMWQSITYYDGEKYDESKFVPSFLVGGGFRLGGMTAMIQYDVVQDKDSPYGNSLFYSIGYTFRF